MARDIDTSCQAKLLDGQLSHAMYVQCIEPICSDQATMIVGDYSFVELTDNVKKMLRLLRLFSFSWVHYTKTICYPIWLFNTIELKGIISHSQTSVHLIIDSTVAHQNLEKTLVAPGVVPGVNAEPVVLSVLNSPADALDGMTTLGGSSQVLVNTWGVSEEVFVDGEGSSDGSVGVDLLFDCFDTFDAVCWSTFHFVVRIVDRCVAGASGTTNRRVGDNRWARNHTFYSDVMSASLHGVIIAVLTLIEGAPCDNTGSLEPGEGSRNLATIAAVGEAWGTIAAGCSISNREKLLEWTSCFNTHSVVECFSCSVSPARATVRLVAHEVNDVRAFGPVFSGIKVDRKSIVINSCCLLNVTFNPPCWVYYCAHKASYFFMGGALELVIHSSSPGGFGVVVNVLDDVWEVLGLLSVKHFSDWLFFAEAQVLAGSEGVR